MLSTCRVGKTEDKPPIRHARTASGEEHRQAFEAKALPHLAAVYDFSLGLTRNPHVAEDVTQETFLNAYRGFRHFERGSNCKSWLFKVCKNVFIDRFRRRVRRPMQVPLENLEPVSLDPSFDKRVFEERGLENEDLYAVLFGDKINRYLEELPGQFRQALFLCDVEGFSYQEIAEVMDTPVGTVRSRIFRARNFLKERLETGSRKELSPRRAGTRAKLSVRRKVRSEIRLELPAPLKAKPQNSRKE